MTRLLALLACLLCGNAAWAGDSDDPQRQVLVMLQLPPPHFRPDGQYAGGYGGEVGSAARRAIAGELARRHGLVLVTSWPMAALSVDCFVLAVPAPGETGAMAEVLARDPRVAWAQPMNLYRSQAASHNDPLYPTQPAASAWRLADLHELATGRGVRVAVIDSGVDATHPDLLGQVALADNFVEGRASAPERHGTAVAGIVAALADNRLGTAGVAPRVQLLALRACWQERDSASLCTSLALAKALLAALGHQAAVINLSLSGPPDRLLGLLLDLAIQQGIAVVAAFDRALPDGGFPASHPGVVAVADAPAPHALTAPGRDVPVPAPGARWEMASGGSYAAAHVTGLFALLRELGAGAAPVLQRDASGGIDACATLLRRVGTRQCACAMPADLLTVARP